MINLLYTLFDDFMSGRNRLAALLDRAGFSYEYDPSTEEIVRRKGHHIVVIDNHSTSCTGPFGEMYDLSFKEMIRFLREPGKKPKQPSSPFPGESRPSLLS